ncbi:MAG: HobA family DNA replication regulator [Arcobacteraceae bacterium]|nr:HobA family DNA replication regulator [Arcobacteraceae bacterium]
MQEFTNWTVKTIREDRYIGSWMEERKFDWIPIVSKMVSNIIDKNRAVLIITDDDRDWFLTYILNKINSPKNDRPLLPFFDFNSFVQNADKLTTEDDIELVKDMLDISFPKGYIFWYIGRSQNKKATLAKVSKNSFLWLFDEDRQNSFNLNSHDEALDMKLFQLYRLFDKTLDATLFAQIEVDK